MSTQNIDECMMTESKVVIGMMERNGGIRTLTECVETKEKRFHPHTFQLFIVSTERA